MGMLSPLPTMSRMYSQPSWNSCGSAMARSSIIMVPSSRACASARQGCMVRAAHGSRCVHRIGRSFTRTKRTRTEGGRRPAVAPRFLHAHAARAHPRGRPPGACRLTLRPRPPSLVVVDDATGPALDQGQGGSPPGERARGVSAGGSRRGVRGGRPAGPPQRPSWCVPPSRPGSTGIAA